MAQIGQFDTDSAALIKRIAAHDLFGTNDLNSWCFEQVGLQKGMTVLDLGCGTGKQTLDLSARGCKVVAVDASESALATVNETAAAKGLSNIRTVHCRLDEVPDKVTGAFDRCISAYAIYYVKDAARLFRFIEQALHPGSQFFFCGPAYDNNREMKEFLTSIGQTFVPGAAPFMEETGPALAKTIFTDVTLSKFENPLTFDSAEAMWTYWSSHNMFDASVEDRFRRTADAHFRQHGKFTLVKRVRGVLARK